jgi:hypothetical protein
MFFAIALLLATKRGKWGHSPYSQKKENVPVFLYSLPESVIR